MCEHCLTSFSRKLSMINHQKTALFCLDIQKNKGLIVKKEEYTCQQCGSVFTQSSNLSRHKKTCSNIIVQNNVAINPVKIIPSKPFLIPDLQTRKSSLKSHKYFKFKKTGPCFYIIVSGLEY